MKFMGCFVAVWYYVGLLLLFCGGMHTVWGIYQMVMYDTSRFFRRDLKRKPENETATTSTVAPTTSTVAPTTSTRAPPTSTTSTAASATLATLTASSSNVPNPTSEAHKSSGEDHLAIFQSFHKWIFPSGALLKLTIIMWYVGIILGCFLAGWFLVRVVQKKNIYVSQHYYYQLFQGNLSIDSKKCPAQITCAHHW